MINILLNEINIQLHLIIKLKILYIFIYHKLVLLYNLYNVLFYFIINIIKYMSKIKM